MKKINIQVFVLLMLTLFNACKEPVLPDSECKYLKQIERLLEAMGMPRPVDAYNYPVYPGMDEWAELSGEERISLCQVSEARLKKMSTQAVIQAIYEHPSYRDFGYQSILYQDIFERLFKDNNAYLELKQRQDAGTSLLVRLQLIDPLYLPVVVSCPLELCIRDEVFLSKLTQKEQKELVKIQITHNSLRMAESQSFMITHEIVPGLWLMTSIMRHATYPPFINEIEQNDLLRSFCDTKLLVGYEQDESVILLNSILAHAETFCK